MVNTTIMEKQLCTYKASPDFFYLTGKNWEILRLAINKNIYKFGNTPKYPYQLGSIYECTYKFWSTYKLRTQVSAHTRLGAHTTALFVLQCSSFICFPSKNGLELKGFRKAKFPQDRVKTYNFRSRFKRTPKLGSYYQGYFAWGSYMVNQVCRLGGSQVSGWTSKIICIHRLLH